jgi:phage-related protein
VIDLFRQLQETGPGLMDAVAEAVDRLGGPLMALGGALGDLLPTLHEVGIIVGELVFPALTDLFNLIDQGVEAFLSLGENLRELGVAGAISAPAIFGVASAIGSLTGPLGVAAAAVLAFVAAYRSNFLGIQEVTDDVIGGVIDTFREYVDAVRPAVEGVIDVLMAYGNAIRDAFQSGSGTAISGLIDNIQGLASQYVSLVGDIANQVLPIFDIVAGTLRSNSDQFAAFGRMAINAVNGLVTVIRTVFLPAIRFVLMNFTIPLITRLARVWSNNFGAILSETIQTINAIRSFIQPALTALGNFWTSHGDTITSAVKFAFDAIIGIIGTALDAVYTIILVALNLIQGDWQEAIRLIADFFVDAFIGLTEFIQDWGIIDAFQNAVRAMISGVVTLITQTLPELFIQGLATVFTIIQNFGSSLGNTLIMIFNGVVGIIVDAINGLITTATDAINSILETINTVADEVSEIPGVDDVSLDTLDAATIDASSIQQDRGAIVNQRDRERNAQAIRAAVDLTINGTGALADLLREETDASVETSRRADTRRLRRQGVDR